MLAVKTNVGYQEVALFACQQEDADSIAEALQIIKNYITLHGIKVRVIMTDNCKAEAEAIARVFPGKDFLNITYFSAYTDEFNKLPDTYDYRSYTPAM